MTNPHWVRLSQAIEEFEETNHLRLARKGRGFQAGEGRGESWFCPVWWYRRVENIDPPKGEGYTPEKYLYHFHTALNARNELYVTIEGPYVDSDDDYWLDMVEQDRNGNALITERYTHYTVGPDSIKPGAGDGFGGWQFRVQLLTPLLDAHVLENKGLKIERLEEGQFVLTTRNLWQQGVIPTAHRHLFRPNCKVL
jgi:hypothetical protein